jgi:hypothetical protein
MTKCDFFRYKKLPPTSVKRDNITSNKDELKDMAPQIIFMLPALQ